jgi:hypothetical protein
MTFHPRALLIAAAFAGALLLAVDARGSGARPALAIAAVTALVAIEGLTWMGPALFTRVRR